MTADEALAACQQKNVRVDMWAFPTYTRITLRRQVTPGRGAWGSLGEWHVTSVPAGQALVRVVAQLERIIENWLTRQDINRLANEAADPWWRANAGKGLALPAELSYAGIYAQQMHRLHVLEDIT